MWTEAVQPGHPPELSDGAVFAEERSCLNEGPAAAPAAVAAEEAAAAAERAVD